MIVRGLSADPDADFEEPKGKECQHEGDGKCKVLPLDKDFAQDIQDMVKMKVLNDAELSKNLMLRFIRQEAHTDCGITLVCVNLKQPGRMYGKGGPLEYVYANAALDQFSSTGDRSKNPPHIWNLTSHCYHNIEAKVAPPVKANQAIIITGESGAGKTFNTEKVLYTCHLLASI